MPRRLLARIVLLPLMALAITSLWTAAAEAGGLILITRGNTIKHVAEVSDPMKPVVRSVTGTSTNYHVGFLHERFGVYWIDLWTWGGEYVLYDDSEEDLWSLDPDQTAAIMGTTPDELSKPIFYTFPPGLLALGAIGAVCLGMQNFAGKSKAVANKEVERLLEDPRYEQSLEMLLKHHQQKQLATVGENSGQETFEDDAVVFDRAVGQLVEQGVPYNDAYCNLNMLLEAAYAHQAS
jgi:hypothetical protein